VSEAAPAASPPTFAPRRREAGILLHPTSLPGPFPVGDLGPAVDRFLDWAQLAGFSWWQVLPLGPPGEGSSPYTARSAFAGNPLLISPEALVAEGVLAPEAARDATPGGGWVDFATVGRWKEGLLRQAWERYRADPPAGLREALLAFAADPRHAWLPDWELFSALAERHRAPWLAWPAPLARREAAALEAARGELLAECGYHRFVQFLFFRQWHRVREAARARGVGLIGDLPIYVAHDSADVWAHPDLFDLDASGHPRHVAGCPPDYFCPTGQRWGNPLYRWERMAADGYRWWVERLRGNLELTDRVRLDHFRGVAGYWQVPASEPTAIHGRWVQGPGAALLAALREGVGELPLIAEDLGVITPDVEVLRDAAGLPGMRVLHFAFGDADSSHLPHNHERRSVVYTGTHDNDTTVGWFAKLSAGERGRVLDYLGGDGMEPHWDLVRAAYTSVAELAVVPLQDVLGLGSEARMNVPGEAAGNWGWRARPEELRREVALQLHRLAELSSRLPATR
jgi:4-alpha-glucanotransferase